MGQAEPSMGHTRLVPSPGPNVQAHLSLYLTIFTFLTRTGRETHEDVGAGDLALPLGTCGGPFFEDVLEITSSLSEEAHMRKSM